MLKSDIIGIVILLGIYIFQGILIGFGLGALPVILIEKGTSYADLSVLLLTSVPFSLKIIWAPLLDKYFFESFGKRKTYIIPCQYLIGIIYFIYSFYLDAHIEASDTVSLSIVMFVSVFLICTADIAADGWVLTLLSEENVTLGSTCQSIGQSLGFFTSQHIYVQLSSVKFANDYIYSQPSAEPLITYGDYLKFWGIFGIVFTFIIHVFIKEKNPKTREFVSVWKTYGLLKGLYTNKNLRFLSLFYITCNAGFMFFEKAGFLELVKNGLPKETLSTIGILVYPLQFIVPIILTKFTLKKMEMQSLFYGMMIRILFLITLMIAVNIYSPGSGYWTLALIFFASCLQQVGRLAMDVSMYAFNTRVCDASVGGTFITALASVSNIPKTLFPSMGLAILGFANFSVFVSVSIIYQVWYTQRFFGPCKEMQEASKESLDLDYIENEGYIEMKALNKTTENETSMIASSPSKETSDLNINIKI